MPHDLIIGISRYVQHSLFHDGGEYHGLLEDRGIGNAPKVYLEKYGIFRTADTTMDAKMAGCASTAGCIYLSSVHPEFFSFDTSFPDGQRGANNRRSAMMNRFSLSCFFLSAYYASCGVLYTRLPRRIPPPFDATRSP